MIQAILIFLILAGIFNFGVMGRINQNQKESVETNKITASIFNLSNFKLSIKKLPSEIAEKITATNVLVKEFGGGAIYDRKAEEVKSIASLTKIMTSLIAYQIYSENEKFIITANAIKTEGESGGFLKNETFKRNDLIKSGLIGSSNDATFSLAEKKGMEKFINLMNSKAQEIGMTKTRYSDPTGISKSNESSLNDLENLMEYISRTAPEIFNFSKIERITLNGKYIRTIENLDYLIPFYRDYIVASKTGFTIDAGECLILVLKFEKSPFIFVGLLNSKNRFEDAEKLIISLKDLY